MKKLLLIISLVLIGFVSNAQIQTPDTLQLSAKEGLKNLTFALVNRST